MFSFKVGLHKFNAKMANVKIEPRIYIYTSCVYVDRRETLFCLRKGGSQEHIYSSSLRRYKRRYNMSKMGWFGV